MLKLLKNSSHKRMIWFLVFLSVFIIELTAIWFSLDKKVQPCALCIYERYALLGIMASSIIGIIAPKTFLRYIAIFIWLYSAWKGIKLSWMHNKIQYYPMKFFDSCHIVSSYFPEWLPLNQWISQIYTISNDCNTYQWELFSIKITLLLMVIFSVYFCFGFLILISQLRR